jgi:hypothetical protein
MVHVGMTLLPGGFISGIKNKSTKQFISLAEKREKFIQSSLVVSTSVNQL